MLLTTANTTMMGCGSILRAAFSKLLTLIIMTSLRDSVLVTRMKCGAEFQSQTSHPVCLSARSRASVRYLVARTAHVVAHNTSWATGARARGPDSGASPLRNISKGIDAAARARPHDGRVRWGREIKRRSGPVR